jgi:hypothetical protein
MISRFARLHPPPRRLSQGERAALFGALFFATLGVMIFAATLGYAGCFLLAMGWTLVLVEVDRWAGPRGG